MESVRFWHQKLSLRERRDGELLTLFRLDKDLARQISQVICKQFRLPKVDIHFLIEDLELLGSCGDNVITLHGSSGQTAECLVHELAHHLAENRKDKQLHGEKFVQAYKELLLIVKEFLETY